MYTETIKKKKKRKATEKRFAHTKKHTIDRPRSQKSRRVNNPEEQNWRAKMWT